MFVDKVDIDCIYISLIERGVYVMSIDVLDCLVKVFGVEVSELFCRC